jgi:DNA-binding MarR family transcriptional regulator
VGVVALNEETRRPVVDDALSREESLRQLEQEMGVVIRRLRRVIGERARAVHESLQPASYLMLAYVEEHGPCRASEMVEVFDIDKGAISRQVQHLMTLGLLQGAADPWDRRATLLSITPEAVHRMQDVQMHRRRRMDQRLGDMSTQELSDFVTGLSRYNRALNVEQNELA